MRGVRRFWHDLMLGDKTIINIRRISLILLIGSPVLLVISLLDEGKKYEDLDIFEGELVSIREKSLGYSPDVLWFTLENAQGRFTACIRSNWRTLKNLPLGSDIELRGYHFGPCGIQAMEVSQNGRVIVSYADFIENVNLGNTRLRIMSYIAFACSLIAFLFSVYTRPDIKTFK